MVDYPCSQLQQITETKWKVSFLEQNHLDVMEEIKGMKKDMKDWFNMVNISINEIKRYMFEGGMDDKYAKRKSVDRLWTIVWSVIGFISLWVGGALLSQIFK